MITHGFARGNDDALATPSGEPFLARRGVRNLHTVGLAHTEAAFYFASVMDDEAPCRPARDPLAYYRSTMHRLHHDPSVPIHRAVSLLDVLYLRGCFEGATGLAPCRFAVIRGTDEDIREGVQPTVIGCELWTPRVIDSIVVAMDAHWGGCFDTWSCAITVEDSPVLGCSVLVIRRTE